uniref:Uncharacterized protein n=1 Tax=Geospiza parvula TaxID=87175 RepID=A0A8C3QD33_GEOPR
MAAAARLLPLLLLPLGWARPGACTDPLGGGWLAGTVPEEPRCTVERADASLTYSLFLQRFAFSRPVILGGVTDNSVSAAGGQGWDAPPGAPGAAAASRLPALHPQAFRALCTREKLLAAFGPFPVRLSTANTYSYRKGERGAVPARGAAAAHPSRSSLRSPLIPPVHPSVPPLIPPSPFIPPVHPSVPRSSLPFPVHPSVPRSSLPLIPPSPLIPPVPRSSLPFIPPFPRSSLRSPLIPPVHLSIPRSSLPFPAHPSRSSLPFPAHLSVPAVDVPFQEYVEHLLKPQDPARLGSDTLYFFGDNNFTEWGPLFQHYVPPPFRIPGTSPAYSLGIAALVSVPAGSNPALPPQRDDAGLAPAHLPHAAPRPAPAGVHPAPWGGAVLP